MTYDVDNMVVVGRLFLVLAAVMTTAYPVIYSLMPWYKSRLGRAMMLKAIAFNMLLWLKVILTFFLNDHTRTFLLWFNAITLILIGIATSLMTFELLRVQRKQIRDWKAINEQPDKQRSAK